MNQAKGQFQVSLPQFKKNLGDMMITIDDSFIKMLSETLTTKLSAIELSTMDALNQSIPPPSRRRSSATRCRSRASTAPSRICRGAQGL